MHEIHVTAHCLLNPAVRLKGLKPLEPLSLKDNVIQLPCPESIYLGPNRWEVTKEQLDIPNYRRFCRRIFQPAADTIEMLYRSGYDITLVGVKGSPSCGALTTSMGMEGGRLREADHTHVQGRGIFFEEIIQELGKRGVEFNIKE
ncbi:MAG: hypothetical protein P1P80_07520 [ANME-2 cluster archaeon]|nr:hypothetical protein [ANME-2 cluster archaeon]